MPVFYLICFDCGKYPTERPAAQTKKRETKRGKKTKHETQNILHIFCGNIIKIQSSNSLANYYLHNFNNVRKIEIIKRWK